MHVKEVRAVSCSPSLHPSHVTVSCLVAAESWVLSVASCVKIYFLWRKAAITSTVHSLLGPSPDMLAMFDNVWYGEYDTQRRHLLNGSLNKLSLRKTWMTGQKDLHGLNLC